MTFFAGNSKDTKKHIQLNKKCQKPIEIYIFIDPICPECWALEPILKKLQLQYGNYVTLRYVITGKLTSLNISKRTKPSNVAEIWEKTASRSGMSCDGDLWFENPISSPYSVSFAIKAAELQGKAAGIRFLRKLREVLFLDRQNISNEEALIQIARDTGLDVDEFEKDLHSKSSAKAFQCDLKITREMEVEENPTIVFFNQNVEDEGIKISGIYTYEVYVQILEDMLQKQLEPCELPDLVDFLKIYKFVASKEISVVYDWNDCTVNSKMKKLVLKQKVEMVPVKYGTFWRYIEK